MKVYDRLKPNDKVTVRCGCHGYLDNSHELYIDDCGWFNASHYDANGHCKRDCRFDIIEINGEKI